MSRGQLLGEGGHYRVSGELTFSTVNALLNESRAILFSGAGEALELDLGEVSRADSAGLALLIQWMRMAHHGGRTIRFLNLPQQLLAIAEASDLDEILPIPR